MWIVLLIVSMIAILEMVVIYRRENSWVKRYNKLADTFNQNVKKYNDLSVLHEAVLEKHDSILTKVAEKQVVLVNFKKDHSIN